MKKVLSLMRRAIEDYDMIQEGDKIAVGVSGGKDSITLLYGLKLLQAFFPKKFEVIGITVDMGFPDFDLSPTIRFCQEKNIPYHIIPSEIGRIVFEIRKEKNPCSLCANLRRGILNGFAKDRLSCNKVALAHHSDDAIETLFLSMFFEGRISTFSPVTYLTRKDVTVIRPLIYIDEHIIKGTVKRNQLPVVPSPCPANTKTKRQYIKDLIRSIEMDIPEIKERILTAIKNKEQVRLW